jgi:hypothetical protein
VAGVAFPSLLFQVVFLAVFGWGTHCLDFIVCFADLSNVLGFVALGSLVCFAHLSDFLVFELLV